MSQSESIEIYLGVDVSDQWIDVCALQTVDRRILFQKRLARTVEAVGELAREIERPALAVLEGTGGLEVAPARALESFGVGVRVVNPAQARHYALSNGKLEKSDRLDARILAEFGLERQFFPREKPDPKVEELALLTTRRRQLVQMRAVEKIRLPREESAFNRKSIAQLMTHLSRQIEKIEREILRRICADQKMKRRFELLKSAPGVGDRTAAELTALLPELGRMSRGEAAKMVGVAPLVKQSGKWKGRVMTMGGRAPVRTALYLAAMSTLRTSSYFRDRHDLLRKRGKSGKCALIALARQLLTVLNQMVREDKEYDPGLLIAVRG